MADRVILMRAGRIEHNGSPAVLYERPQTVFTARFVGSPAMNVLPAAMLAGSGVLATGAPAQRELATMAFGVRPEACALPQRACPPASLRSNISAPTARSRRAWASTT